MRVTLFRTRRNPDAPLCDPKFDQIENLKPNTEVAVPKAADLLGMRKDDIDAAGLRVRTNPSGRPYVPANDLQKFARDLAPVHLAETDAPPADDEDDQTADLDLDGDEAAIILPIRVLRKLFGVASAPAPVDTDDEEDDVPPPPAKGSRLPRLGR